MVDTARDWGAVSRFSWTLQVFQGVGQSQILEPYFMPPPELGNPTWVSSILRPCLSHWGCHRLSQDKRTFAPSPLGDLSLLPGPLGYSSSSFGAAVDLGTREAQDWGPAPCTS